MCFGKAADRSEKLLSPYFDFGIFFMPNSVILIASARLNFSTALSPLLSFFTVLKLIPVPVAIALTVDFSRISLIIFMSAFSPIKNSSF